MEIIKTEKAEDLQRLYDGSAWTWEGITIDEESLNSIIKWFKDQECPLKEEKVYVTKGKLMNEVYGLTGKNRYKNNLKILSIELKNIKDVGKLFMKKFEVGARWFDDIVENNRTREEQKES